MSFIYEVGAEHRHKISFLILNITPIYQIVKTDFQNDIIKYFITSYNSDKFSREMRFQVRFLACVIVVGFFFSVARILIPVQINS